MKQIITYYVPSWLWQNISQYNKSDFLTWQEQEMENYSLHPELDLQLPPGRDHSGEDRERSTQQRH